MPDNGRALIIGGVYDKVRIQVKQQTQGHIVALAWDDWDEVIWHNRRNRLPVLSQMLEDFDDA